MSKQFIPCNLDQHFLLPPDMRDWLPEGHLAWFIDDVVDRLDVSAFLAVYSSGSKGGRPPYAPQMMIKLIIYAYCTGTPSSRAIERATYEQIPYRVLTGGNHPDHDCIAAFRKEHLTALAAIFKQTVRLAIEMGLVKLGHMSLDGTKVKANASKHKAMSYGRMDETMARLEKEIADLLAESATVDANEDAAFGKGKRGDELPKEIQRRRDRIAKIAEAKEVLEQRAKAAAEIEAAEIQAKLAERAKKEAETGKKVGGRVPEVPDPETAKPDPKLQQNFTDPESRIMRDGATKEFTQAYNAQAVADDHCQIIVAADVTQQANDKQQLVPMMAQVLENVGQLPTNTSADAGYFSEKALNDASLNGTDLHVPSGRQKHGEPEPAEMPETPRPAEGESVKNPSKKEEMDKKLAAPAGRQTYKQRKQIIEPVFGQIKHCRGFRQFSLRGKTNVTHEWQLVCAVHNLLKIFKYGGKLPQMAAA